MFEFDGRHLLADVLVDNGDTLSDPAIGIEMLEAIVERVDMTMILPPITVKFPHSISEMHRVLLSLEREGLTDSKTAQKIRNALSEREDGAYGYSTFVMIAESHISLHTFPELNYFSFDCYSCKYFEVDAVEEIIRDYFPVRKMNTQRLVRHIPS
jgi:hypothetical protein